MLILIILVAVIAVYFTFFYPRKCGDATCFNSALLKCKRAKYIDDLTDAVWSYRIKGKSGDKCQVDVKLLQLKRGASEMVILEGKEMTCYLPLGVITSPQEDLKKCHGLLKEEMQSLIINRLHNYIVENLGEISEELKKPL